MGFALAIYAVGVFAGLLLTDARPLARLVIALSWPLGVAAFAVIVSILLVAAMLVFPLFGVLAFAAAVTVWLWL